MNKKNFTRKLILVLFMPTILAAQNTSTVNYIPKHEELVYTFGGQPAKMHLAPSTTSN